MLRVSVCMLARILRLTKAPRTGSILTALITIISKELSVGVNCHVSTCLDNSNPREHHSPFHAILALATISQSAFPYRRRPLWRLPGKHDRSWEYED
jgi:hypothetical protein